MNKYAIRYTLVLALKKYSQHRPTSWFTACITARTNNKLKKKEYWRSVFKVKDLKLMGEIPHWWLSVRLNNDRSVCLVGHIYSWQLTATIRFSGATISNNKSVSNFWKSSYRTTI